VETTCKGGYSRKGCCVELTIPASPAHLAGLRRAARHSRRHVSDLAAGLLEGESLDPA